MNRGPAQLEVTRQSSFLDRHKRKSALAALLLFLRRRKALIALLIVAGLVTFNFVGSHHFMGVAAAFGKRIPGMRYLASAVQNGLYRIGLAAYDRDGFDDLLASFKAEQKNAIVEASLIRVGPLPSAQGVNLVVKGSLSDLGQPVGNKVKGGQSVDGILTPEDAQSGPEGVQLTQGDVRGGKGPGLEALYGQLEGAPKIAAAPFVSRDFFTAPGVRVDDGSIPLPETPGGRDPGWQNQGGRKQRWVNPPESARSTRRQAGGAEGRRRCLSRNDPDCAIKQLGEGYVHNKMAARCNADGMRASCPSEYSTTQSGAVYEGMRVGITPIETAPVPMRSIDDITTMNVVPPSNAEALLHNNYADMVENGMSQCRAANEAYDDALRAQSQSIESMCQQMRDACRRFRGRSSFVCFWMIIFGGECGEGRRCRGMRDALNAMVGNYNGLVGARRMSCNLEGDPYAPAPSPIATGSFCPL
ncbi:MAG: hypothetical protein HY549_10745 [Elusimicrobia bacterium]|nr:hypothetical protein [Elusimicrobiota bacterium]